MSDVNFVVYEPADNIEPVKNKEVPISVEIKKDAFDAASQEYKFGYKKADDEALLRAKLALSKAEDRKDSWDVFSDDDAAGKILVSAGGVGAAAGLITGVGFGVLTNYPLESYPHLVFGSPCCSAILSIGLAGLGFIGTTKAFGDENPRTLPGVINYLNDKRIAKKEGHLEATEFHNKIMHTWDSKENSSETSGDDEASKSENQGVLFRVCRGVGSFYLNPENEFPNESEAGDDDTSSPEA